MSDYSELVKRLLAWSETPHEGDPMIDALLCDVPAAGRAIEDLMRKVEVATSAFRTINSATINTKPQCAVIARAALQKMEE